MQQIQSVNGRDIYEGSAITTQSPFTRFKKQKNEIHTTQWGHTLEGPFHDFSAAGHHHHNIIITNASVIVIINIIGADTPNKTVTAIVLGNFCQQMIYFILICSNICEKGFRAKSIREASCKDFRCSTGILP